MLGIVIDPRAHPSEVGLGLVGSAAVIIATSVWLLPVAGGDQRRSSVIAMLMLVAAIGWWTMTKDGRQQRQLLAYPLIVFAGIAAIGNSTAGVATTYGSFFTFAFIFVGLFGPRRSTVPMLVPATICWLYENDAFHSAPVRALEVRLPMALIIWAMVGALLSQHAEATKRAAASLRREAHRDALTGLRNRRVLNDLLASATTGDVIALLDIDHFKAVNDNLGHAAGDALLTDFARILVRSIRDQDLAVRFGGDEFLIYFPCTSTENVTAVVSRLRDAWATHQSAVTFSAGLAQVRVGRDGTDAFGEADRLLYQAKNSGRNRTECPAGWLVPRSRPSSEVDVSDSATTPASTP